MLPTTDDQISWDTMRENPGRLAAFMLHHIDANPNRLAVFEVPPEAVAVGIHTVERVFTREYERAKAERPNLCMNIAPAGADYPDAAWLVAIHEHEWVGGRCARGCGHTRDAA
jgi:hypothetical protein